MTPPDTPSPPRRMVFTICSKNYLPRARILIASLRKFMGDWSAGLILADETEEADQLSAYVGTKILPARALDLPTYDDMAMRYDVLEFNTAVKPAAFQYWFQQGFDQVIYLDPDTELMSPLDEVASALDKGARGVITPHITGPLDMDKDPTELKLIRTGIYNLGFAAFSRSPETYSFLSWWSSKMPTECRVDLDAGIFVDQKYVDMMPSYLPGTHILRHPGYNVAYWNLAQRKLNRAPDGGWLSSDESLRFMHYSGFGQAEGQTVSIHQSRLLLPDLCEGAELFEDYRQRIRQFTEELKSTKIDLAYAYDHFASGEPVLPLLRRVYAKYTPPHKGNWQEVFDLGRSAYLKGFTGINHAS
ncbi:MAG: hypothetical protein AAGG79_00805, partial [Pseudomonadota bacterium]